MLVHIFSTTLFALHALIWLSKLVRVDYVMVTNLYYVITLTVTEWSKLNCMKFIVSSLVVRIIEVLPHRSKG